MKTKNLTSTVEDSQVVETLQGIVCPAICCLNQLTRAQQLYYAPNLVCGKDNLIKLMILLLRNLYSPEVIRKLLSLHDECLFRQYLKNSQQKIFGKNANLSECKRQMIENNDEEFLRIYLEQGSLTPQEESLLLKVRKSMFPDHKYRATDHDDFMKEYMRTHKLHKTSISLMHKPEYVAYWNLYVAQTPMNFVQIWYHKFCLKWYCFVYWLG